MVAVSPLGNRAVAFQAAVRDYRAAIYSFRNNLGFLKGRIRIALYLFGFLLKWRVAGLGLLDWRGLQRLDDSLADFVVLHSLGHLRRQLEGESALLRGGD